jgi:hypothetical protein
VHRQHLADVPCKLHGSNSHHSDEFCVPS